MHRTLWASMEFFLSCCFSHWWMTSTASLLGVPHIVCGIYAKNSTAELLTAKGIQLPLIFRWGFQPPQGVINLDPVFQIATPVSVRTRVLSAGISHAICFWFPATLPECLTGGSGLSGKCMNFWTCLHKVNWLTLVEQEMQKSTRGSQKLLDLPVLCLHFWPCCFGHERSKYGLSNRIKTTLFNLF